MQGDLVNTIDIRSSFRNQEKRAIIVSIKFSRYLGYWLQISNTLYDCYFGVSRVWHAVHYSVHARCEGSRFRLRQNNIIVSPKMLVFYKPFRMI